MTFENADDYEMLSQDSKLTITGIVGGMKCGRLAVTTDTGFTFYVNCDLTTRQQAILLAGGLLNYTKNLYRCRQGMYLLPMPIQVH